MASKFTASTREVLEALGLQASKSLHRRRTDYTDNARPDTFRFLEPGIHFRQKTPGSPQLVWDLDATVRAWDVALKHAPVKGGEA